MGFLDLFRVASMPILQVLIVTSLGAFLALESINILGESTRKQLNEVIPQAITARYGLVVGANFVGLIRVLMVICYPIAYPVGKLELPHWSLLHSRSNAPYETN